MSLNNGIVISHLQHSLVVINRATFCFSMWIYIYIYMYIYIYIYIYRKTGHFSRHLLPAVVRFRTSSSARDLTIILELSAQKQQHHSLSHSSRSTFFGEVPFSWCELLE